MSTHPSRYQSFCVDHWGYEVPGEAKRSLVYPLRFKPLMTLLLVAAGAAAGWPWMLVVVGGLGLIGTAFPPLSWLDRLWNHAIRYPFRAPALPDDPDPRRFACGLADAFVLTSGLAFLVGWTTAAWVLAGCVLVIAGTVVATGFCVAAWAYVVVKRRLTGQRRREPTRSLGNGLG